MASRSILVFAAVVVLICGCILQEAEAARVKRSSLSDDDKAEMLRAHNHFRGMVNPISTNMERMVISIGIIKCSQPHPHHGSDLYSTGVAR